VDFYRQCWFPGNDGFLDPELAFDGRGFGLIQQQVRMKITFNLSLEYLILILKK
jgi:hypothetical protein